MRKWDELPRDMKNMEVKYYYQILQSRKASLIMKRVMDILLSAILLIILLPLFLLVGIIIKVDSHGPVMFRQMRITQYERKFRIFKFRTMVENAEQVGTQVTTKGDMRVTRVGKFLRKYRIDEIPQLINIFLGDMTFVGTRPEVEKYVHYYTDAMKATLLLPAGVTSRTSILYKDEEKLLDEAKDADEVYVNIILPEKMKYNLALIEEFNFWEDIKTMLLTVKAVIKR
ncbi:sugar transferase [Bariatricus massiliensis]|uniref:Sugar transferase n=1 Tax=Bariatricus massiliensis TaxID=1745713 RepID=A0ABS8DIZ2_9FIRM|nr:sugar transferase [Bariatricus massiliensis]MCB7305218.1 sugar transferase [Bariatricus massiliensis]MCB7375674.1 sugar transferase [Bariatricus massiliensis]MCB7388361.1 sugar transferase [Bariatricus massiliensis]MCB7412436.1 sugar transferase [Bariatricus massiliensis]MCQ5254170.1 sugar transferase [Bariatricus massiliensis]